MQVLFDAVYNDCYISFSVASVGCKKVTFPAPFLGNEDPLCFHFLSFIYYLHKQLESLCLLETATRTQKKKSFREKSSLSRTTAVKRYDANLMVHRENAPLRQVLVTETEMSMAQVRNESTLMTPGCPVKAAGGVNLWDDRHSKNSCRLLRPLSPCIYPTLYMNKDTCGAVKKVER